MWLHNVCTPSFVIIRKSSSKNVGNCISGYSSDTMEGTKPPVAAIHPSYLLIWLLMQMLQGNANIKEALYVLSVLHYCTTEEEEGVSIQSYITSQIIFSTSVPVWSVHHISFCCSICWFVSFGEQADPYVAWMKMEAWTMTQRSGYTGWPVEMLLPVVFLWWSETSVLLYGQ